MIKVYLWKVRLPNVGHLSMELTDGTYISFWPEGEGVRRLKDKVTKLDSDSQKSYQDDIDDEGRPADEILRLPDDIVDQEKVKAWWKKFVPEIKYHLLVNNCAAVVKEAFLVGGIYQTARVSQGGGNQFSPVPTPGEIFEWIEECNALYPDRDKDIPAVQLVKGIWNFFKS